MELTDQEKIDLHMAILSRMSRIEEMQTIEKFKDSKEYKDEYKRMILLKHKLT